jgi:methylenetetrahydrofolate dehydrogenase (NADP+)/methenyltetrahydrofolate cyclohydrolase
MANLLEGKKISERILEDLKREFLELEKKFKIIPKLCSIQIGENPAVEVYVKAQRKTTKELCIEYQLHKLDEGISEFDLIEFIQKLNQDRSVNGIIIQMPLPPQIDYKKINQFILPEKDAEGVNPSNIGKILFGKAKILPCTPAAVMELLKETEIDLYGKEVVIVGHSEIVGKPLSLLLLDKFATVTVCHIGTSQAGRLEEHVRRAEVLVVAVGKAGLIKGEWIREGAVVIDVGINKLGDRIVGDVEFERANERASWITPVPGGVGPLTVAMLMRNLIEAVKLQV